MSGILCVLAGSGGSPYVGNATVTVGTFTSGTTTWRGFFRTITGSIAPTTWAATGAVVDYLYHATETSAPAYTVIVFKVAGVFPNSGWNTLTIAGTSYSRASANYTSSGGETSWSWVNPATNPFGTVNGATKAIVWS